VMEMRRGRWAKLSCQVYERHIQIKLLRGRDLERGFEWWGRTVLPNLSQPCGKKGGLIRVKTKKIMKS